MSLVRRNCRGERGQNCTPDSFLPISVFSRATPPNHVGRRRGDASLGTLRRYICNNVEHNAERKAAPSSGGRRQAIITAYLYAQFTFRGATDGSEVSRRNRIDADRFAPGSIHQDLLPDLSMQINFSILE